VLVPLLQLVELLGVDVLQRRPARTLPALQRRQNNPELLTRGRTDRFSNTTSTQPCIPLGSLNRVPASAGVRAGMSPLPGGR